MRNHLDLAIKKCEEDINSRVDKLKQGALSHEEYKNVCGQIRGLEFAIDHLKSLLQNMEQEDE